MTRLLDQNVTVPPDCRGAEPYTSAELDALPEPYRSRVWATVQAMKICAEEAVYHGGRQGDTSGFIERGL